MPELTNILVPTDFGKSSDAALACARRIARTCGATLHLLHVVDDVFARGLEGAPFEEWGDQQRVLEDAALASLRERVTPEDARQFDERPTSRRSAQPADAILQFARDTAIDLIVMGTHGREAVDLLEIGSVSARVVHAAPCPVLTVKAGDRMGNGWDFQARTPSAKPQSPAPEKIASSSPPLLRPRIARALRTR
jgi:nucleotide-binding universal stress UspA family protein